MKLARALPAALVFVTVAAASRDDRPLRLKAPGLGSALVEIYPAVSKPRDPIQRIVFERINRDRTAAGLTTVRWDEAASRVAADFCARHIAERSRGHFLTDGIPPYARMAFAGVFGVGSENSASWFTTAAELEDPIQKLALESHERMMEERPPSDGHRRAILDPEATHVGIGYAVQRDQFQMAQEFQVRRLSRLSLSSLSGRTPGVAFEGFPTPNQQLRFVTIAREPGPKPLSPEEASARHSYGYPEANLAYLPEGDDRMHVEGVTNRQSLKIRPDGSFTFEFQPTSPGLYTFLFYTGTGPAAPPRPGGAASVWFDR